jgi:DNA helicase-2/ATP-dependent DNA helicase PcrA
VSNFVVKCNAKLNGKIIDRLCRIYSHIFIDEIQDMAGYDLDIIKNLFNSSSEMIIVGDPRQSTFFTHPTDKYNKYQNGKIEDFIQKEVGTEKCEIDKKTLKASHRNDEKICLYSSKLFPKLPESEACVCEVCRSYSQDHVGIFLIKKQDVSNYILKYNPVQLRWDKRFEGFQDFPIYNFGDSKGMTFERVLIYPTKTIESWIRDNNTNLEEITRAKFYVALTRARQSVAIVMDYNESERIDGVEYYSV